MRITSVALSLLFLVFAHAARLPYASELDCGALTNKQSCVESNCECVWCSLRNGDDEGGGEERGVTRRSGTDGFCFKKGGDQKKEKIEGGGDGSGNCDGGQAFENGSCIGSTEVGLIVLVVALVVACVLLCFLCLCCKFCFCM